MNKKPILKVLTTLIAIIGSLLFSVNLVSANDEDKEIIDLGVPVQTTNTIDAAFGVEDGVNVVYTTVTGSASAEDWPKFNVIDIDNEELLRSFELVGASNAWSHEITKDGRVFIGASSKMFVYDPESKQIQDLGVPISGTSSIWSLTSDEKGNVYGGVFSETINGRVFKIDAETLQMTDLLGEPVDDAEDYVRSLAYYEGHLYAGTGATNGRVFKINLANKEKERIEMPGSPDDAIYDGKYNKMGFTYDLEVVDNYLFAFFNGTFTLHVYDLDKQEWRDETLENIRGLKAVTGSHEGKVYTNKKDGNMWEVDVDTLEERVAMEFDGSIRNSKWIDVANQPEFNGPAMVTISYNGEVVLFDPARQKKVVQPTVIDGIGVNLQSMKTGPDGKVYVSSYMGSDGAVYDPLNNDTFKTFKIGQTEGFGIVGDTLYFGNYPTAKIYGWDTTESITESGPTSLFTIGEEQDRPFVLTEGEGKLLIGTIPDYSIHGGALTIYDPNESTKKGEPVFEVFRNVVENQSVTGLAYRDGIIYGSTSIHGGLGADPIAERAKLFAWDMAKKEVIKEWDLELEGLTGKLPMISGLMVGPDDLIWGTANGFVFAFDPETYEVIKAKNVYPEVTNFGRWRPMNQVLGTDGLLYTNAGDKLTVINPETMEHKMLVDQVSIFDLSEQNDVYFGKASHTMKRLAEIPSQIKMNAPSEIKLGESVSYSIDTELFDWTVALPEHVKVEISSSDESIVSFEDGQLFAHKAGAATVTAAVNWNGVIIIAEPNDIKVTADETIIEIETLQDYDVPFGTTIDSLSLPREVEVKINEDIILVDVVWNEGNPKYDGNKAGTYIFTGTLKSDRKELAGETVTLNVIVANKEKPEESEDPEKDESENGQEDSNKDVDGDNNSGQDNNHIQPGQDQGTGGSSGKLPSTATPLYNLMIIGATIIVIGSILFIWHRKRAL